MLYFVLCSVLGWIDGDISIVFNVVCSGVEGMLMCRLVCLLFLLIKLFRFLWYSCEWLVL